MPTICPVCWRASTIRNLCSGKTWANPSAFSTSAASLPALRIGVGLERLGPEDRIAQIEVPCDLPRDGHLVPSYHLDVHAKIKRGVDRFPRVGAHRVEEGNQPLHTVDTRLVGSRHPEGAEAPFGEGLHCFHVSVRDIPTCRIQREDHLRGAFRDLEDVVVRGP